MLGLDNNQDSPDNTIVLNQKKNKKRTILSFTLSIEVVTELQKPDEMHQCMQRYLTI